MKPKKPKKAAPRMPRKVTREGLLTTETAGVYDLTRVEPQPDADSSAVAAALKAALAHLPKARPAQRVGEWAQEIAIRSQHALADASQPESVKAFAARCVLGARRVCELLGTPATDQADIALAMEAAATLADDWHSLAVNAALESFVAARINATEAARASATARHAKARPKLAERNALAATIARSAANNMGTPSGGVGGEVEFDGESKEIALGAVMTDVGPGSRSEITRHLARTLTPYSQLFKKNPGHAGPRPGRDGRPHSAASAKADEPRLNLQLSTIAKIPDPDLYTDRSTSCT
jgi:hypothetical protein